MTLALQWLPNRYAITRLDATAAWPKWALTSRGTVSVTRRADELSVLAVEADTPAAPRVERGWVGVEIAGTLDFDLVGVVSRLSTALAAAEVPIFVVSTYDTDLIFFKAAHVEDATHALLTVAGLSGSPPATGEASRGSATR